MKRWVLALCAVMVVVGGAVVWRTLRALDTTDPRGLMAQLLRRAEAVQGSRSPDFVVRQQSSWARRFHQGQLPCARWQPPPVSPRQLAAAVSSKAVTEDAVEFGEWLRWRFAREEFERHGAATNAERLAPALEALDGLEGELLRQHPEQAVAVLRSAGGQLGGHLERVEDTVPGAPQGPGDGPRAKLEALVGAHFTLAVQWPQVEVALREQLTRERFEELARLLTEAAAAGAALVPARKLMETRRTLHRRLDVDGFEVPITVSREGDEVVVRSTPERALRFRAPLGSGRFPP
jgi:hypothetical protein